LCSTEGSSYGLSISCFDLDQLFKKRSLTNYPSNLDNASTIGSFDDWTARDSAEADLERIHVTGRRTRTLFAEDSK
jgi:hypothetical protein